MERFVKLGNGAPRGPAAAARPHQPVKRFVNGGRKPGPALKSHPRGLDLEGEAQLGQARHVIR